MKRHVAAFPPLEVELPWEKPGADRPRRKFSLLLTMRFGNAVAVNTWNTHTWKPAPAKAGIIPPRARGAKQWQWEAAPKDGFHVLRHLRLGHARGRVTVAPWLGHSSPTVTLGYYAHFMPEAGTNGRAMLDGVLGSRAH